MAIPQGVTADAGNSCLACDDNCCVRFQGLKVTRREFADLFVDHVDDLAVQDFGEYLQLDSKTGAPCRHFHNGACTVYERRPIECMLFPYTVEEIVVDGDGTVGVEVHSQVHCPIRSRLLPDGGALRDLIARFVRDAFATDRYRLTIHDPITLSRLKLWRAMRKLRRLVA